jgi:hypothetical protein
LIPELPASRATHVSSMATGFALALDTHLLGSNNVDGDVSDSKNNANFFAPMGSVKKSARGARRGEFVL